MQVTRVFLMLLCLLVSSLFTAEVSKAMPGEFKEKLSNICQNDGQLSRLSDNLINRLFLVEDSQLLFDPLQSVETTDSIINFHSLISNKD